AARVAPVLIRLRAYGSRAEIEGRIDSRAERRVRVLRLESLDFAAVQNDVGRHRAALRLDGLGDRAAEHEGEVVDAGGALSVLHLATDASAKDEEPIGAGGAGRVALEVAGDGTAVENQDIVGAAASDRVVERCSVDNEPVIRARGCTEIGVIDSRGRRVGRVADQIVGVDGRRALRRWREGWRRTPQAIG